MSCKNIGRDAVESYILKLIARPINIGCKSSNFIIIMRRVQSLKQPMVRATCFSFYINFTEQIFVVYQSSKTTRHVLVHPYSASEHRSMHQQSYKKPDMYMRVYMCHDWVSLAERLRHWFGSCLPKKSINFTINDHKRCFIVFIIQSFFIHDFCTNKTINFAEI